MVAIGTKSIAIIGKLNKNGRDMNVRASAFVFTTGVLAGGAIVYLSLRLTHPINSPDKLPKVTTRIRAAERHQTGAGNAVPPLERKIATATSPRKDAENSAPEPVTPPTIVNAPANGADEVRYAKAKWKAEKQFGDFLKHFAAIGGDAEKFRALLIERQLMLSDIITAAQAQGLDVGGGQGNRRVDDLIKRSFQEFNSHMKEAMGDDAYREFVKFEGGKPNFNVAQDLEVRLAGSSFELSASQKAELITVLSKAREPNGMRYTYSVQDEDGMPKPMLQIPESALPAVKSILSPQQFQQFSNIYAEQAQQRAMPRPPPITRR
jgi:hypothetical protein